MTQVIPGITVTNKTALKQWLKSDAHTMTCTAWSEGQECCLESLVDWEPNESVWR